MIRIITAPNSLKTKKDQYCFKSTVDQTMDTDQLIKAMIKYNSTITEADAIAVLSVLSEQIKNYVTLGYKVELPFGSVFLKATGTVGHIHDGFIPGTSNHRLTACFKFREDYAREMECSTAYRLAGKGYMTKPEITVICSVLESGKESDSLEVKEGTLIRLRGKNLSFDTEDALQGIFLIAADYRETRVSRYSRTGTNIVDAFIPAELKPGQYQAKIVTKPGTDRYESSIYATALTLS